MAAIVLFVLVKWWQRSRFMAQIRMSRITIDELMSLLESGAATTILDVRTAERRARQVGFPGASACAISPSCSSRPARRSSSTAIVRTMRRRRWLRGNSKSAASNGFDR